MEKLKKLPKLVRVLLLGTLLLCSVFGVLVVTWYLLDEEARTPRLSPSQTWRIGHGVTAMAFSPDKQQLAMATAKESGTAIEVRRVSDGSLLRSIEVPLGSPRLWINHIAFSADGATLTSAGDDGALRVWRVSDGSLVSTPLKQTAPIVTFDYNPDETLLAIASSNADSKDIKGLTVLTMPGGKQVSAIDADRSPQPSSKPFPATFMSLAFVKNDFLATVDNAYRGYGMQLNGEGGIQSVKKYSAPRQINNFDWPTNDIAEVSIDGQFLAEVPLYSRAVYVSALKDDSGETLRWLGHSTESIIDNGWYGHKDEISSIAFAPNNKYLASGGQRCNSCSHDTVDRSVRVWKLSTQKQEFILEGHENDVSTLAWSRDSKVLASADSDGIVNLWDIEK